MSTGADDTPEEEDEETALPWVMDAESACDWAGCWKAARPGKLAGSGSPDCKAFEGVATDGTTALGPKAERGGVEVVSCGAGAYGCSAYAEVAWIAGV